MEIRQDPETGKLLFLLTNDETLGDFNFLAQDYLDGLVNVISNNIGPDVILLQKNQCRLVSICRQQQAVITAIGGVVNALVLDTIDAMGGADYRLKILTKTQKTMEAEFDKLAKILSSE